MARAEASPPLATLVRASREQMHLTQAELARRVGVSRSAIAELEAGRIAQPRAGVFAKLAKALGLSVVVLLVAAGVPESEVLLKVEGDELVLLAASLPQLAGTDRTWLRTRLIELRELLMLRRSRQERRSPTPLRRVGRTARR